MRIFRNFCIALVKAYQIVISPLFVSLGVGCRFSPSCSEYSAQSFESHGVLRGAFLTFFRLARCHPLCSGGLDPVPQRKKSENADG